ncbi:tetratricopeptide repeat protein [bacterium]|nr:tetratricopeptide repeat protein [bacterium]
MTGIAPFVLAFTLLAQPASATDAATLWSQAKEAQRAGRLLDARQSLEQLLLLDPHHKEARKLNSRVCAEIFSASFTACLERFDHARKTGDDLAAMSALREILLLDPDHKEARARQRALAPKTLPAANAAFDRGLALSDEKNYAQAVEEYKKAVLLKPDFIEAVVNLGQLYYQEGEYNQALRCFQEGLTIDPRDPIVLNNLAAAHDALGHYEDAIRLWKAFLKVGKDPLLVPAAQENILTAEGRLLRERLRAEPDNPEVHLAAIENLIQQKRWERARQQLARSRQHPWDEQTRARLDALEKKLEDAEAAAAQRRPPR